MTTKHTVSVSHLQGVRQRLDQAKRVPEADKRRDTPPRRHWCHLPDFKLNAPGMRMQVGTRDGGRRVEEATKSYLGFAAQQKKRRVDLRQMAVMFVRDTQ